MNRITIIGNLTRDPETGTTDGGINWCRFSVAVNGRKKGDGPAPVEYFEVTAWRALADSCGRWLKKGKKVAVEGAAKSTAWIGRDGNAKGRIEVTAQDVEFLSSGEGRPDPTDADAPGGAPAATDGQSGLPVVEPDDLPY